MKNRLHILTGVIFILTACFRAQAQDVQFSQFYAVPLYQNPAFAGSAHTTRATMQQRLQWPAIKTRYITSFFSLDHYFANQKSGVGLYFMKDWQGGSTINSTTVSFQYSYDIHLNRQWTLKSGLAATYVNRSLDYLKLRFPSQFDDTTGYNSSISSPLANISSPRITYADFSTGFVLYRDNVWFGFSADHINKPNQAFVKNNVSRLPVKASLTGGYKFIINKKGRGYYEADKEVSITPTFHYKKQGASDQLDLGIYVMYGEIMTGLWYRGIPIEKTYGDNINNESVIVLLGWKVKEFAISYSYDITVSKLGAYGAGGAHELNLTWYSRKHYKHKKPMKRLPCPDFYKHS